MGDFSKLSDYEAFCFSEKGGKILSGLWFGALGLYVSSVKYQSRNFQEFIFCCS